MWETCGIYFRAGQELRSPVVCHQCEEYNLIEKFEPKKRSDGQAQYLLDLESIGSDMSTYKHHLSTEVADPSLALARNYSTVPINC